MTRTEDQEIALRYDVAEPPPGTVGPARGVSLYWDARYAGLSHDEAVSAVNEQMDRPPRRARRGA